MSWETFKQNILRVANSPEAISDIDVVAEAYAKEYDAAIKRGFDRQHSIPLISGNVEIMKTLFKAALQKGVNSTQPYDLVGEMGQGVKAYWSGATMATAPLPITPAVLATVNLSVTQNIVTDPGVWKQPQSAGNFPPNFELSSERRAEVQEDLEKAQTQYSKAIAENKPIAASVAEDSIQKFEAILIENEEYRIDVPINSVEVKKDNKTEILVPPTTKPVADAAANATPPTTTLEEVDDLVISESTDVVIGEVKFNSGKPFVSGFKAGGGIGGGGSYFGSPYKPFPGFTGNLSMGQKAVEIALYDANQGVAENPAKSDTGHPRIAEMHKNGGAKEGDAWCACAVTTWWLEAGYNFQGHPNKAYCPTWVEWAKGKNIYVDMKNTANAGYTPKAGDAIIYDWPRINGAANHIGIVWKVEGGQIYGVDGNYSEKVATHVTNVNSILGFVII
jgi:hypothetical protein